MNFSAAALLGCLALPILASAASAQAGSPDILLVLSKKDHTVALVDPINLDVIDRIPVGNDPHEVTASDDGRTAYISNYGGAAFNTLAVVDLTTRTALPSIDLGPLRGPHGLTFVNGKVWFTAEAAKAIGRYDPAARKVDWILGTGQNRTHMIYVSDDEQLILTTNVSSGTLSIITQEPVHMGPPPGAPGMTPPPDAAAPNTATPSPAQSSAPVAGGPVGGDHPAMPDHAMQGPGGDDHPPMPPASMPKTDWNETVVRVGHGSEGFDISPDHKEVWIANAQDGTISIVNLADKKVVATLDANVHGANRLKFTPDGKLVLVSLLGAPDLVVLDAATRKETKRIPIGHGAAGIVMQPDGARAYVACTPDDYVVVIDLKTLTTSGRILPGAEPDGMTWVHR